MCQICSSPLQTTDASATESSSLAGTLTRILNDGSLALMISIGHRTGLFDAMSRLDHPATSAAIAKAATLNERYVREWLGAMAAGGIVTVTGTNGSTRYHLPQDHAARLTSAAGPRNLASLAPFLGALAKLEDRIVRCFRSGAGVPYPEFDRAHDVMSERSAADYESLLIEKIIPMIPHGIRRLDQGIAVLDAGCGEGRALVRLARRFPKSTFVGMDLSAEALAVGRALAAEFCLSNLRFEQRDLSTFDADAPEAAFDLVLAFDTLHEQARPEALLRGIARSLRRDGTLLLRDVNAYSEVVENRDMALAPFFYAVSALYSVPITLAQGGSGRGAVAGLQSTLHMLSETGFFSGEIRNLKEDLVNNYYIVRK